MNDSGFNSSMVYEGINFETECLYKDLYGSLKSSPQVDDSYENLIIFPSTFTKDYLVKRLGLKRIRIAVWWISEDSDNFFGSHELAKMKNDVSLYHISHCSDLDFANFCIKEENMGSAIVEMNNYFCNTYGSNDLGKNIIEFENVVSSFSNSIFIDLGVRTGVSSLMMLNYANEKNNEVYGVDVDFSLTDRHVLVNTRHKRLFGDSSSIGKIWNKGEISVLFVDTIHAYEQVMCELRYWYCHVKEGGWIIFHDTEWPVGKHEFIGGKNWERADMGLKNFFGIDSLNYEDDHILVKHFPDSWGMTFVQVKKKKDYVSEFKDWDFVFEQRNLLTSIFWNGGNLGGRKIDLILS